MNEVLPLVYVHAPQDEKAFPLSRYLPPYYPGMATRLIRREVPPASLILDPIGSSPRAALEMAAAYRVVVNCTNPILAFLLSFLSKPSSISDFQATLAELSFLKRGAERLEEHLKSLYITRCVKCRQEVQAEYFLYHRGESAPYARSYQCSDCNDGGQKSVTDEDLERLVDLQKSYPMHRARALEWASTKTADSIKLVNEVLNLYPPRAIYFIFTLLNKIDAMKTDAAREEILNAFMISVLDAGHSLNPYPETGELPRSLAQPADYIEKNLWSVMEAAANDWTQAARPVNFTLWPEIPDQAGLTLHRGRMRELTVENHSLSPAVLFSIIPRPYAAFWTFSAVWSAWLWGKESAAGFMGILERRRFDWSWHSAALQSAFSSASKLMAKDAPGPRTAARALLGADECRLQRCQRQRVETRRHCRR